MSRLGFHTIVIAVSGVLLLAGACSVPSLGEGQATEGPGVSTPGAPTSQLETSTKSKPITLRDRGEGNITLRATPAMREYLQSRGHAPEHIGFVVELDTHWGDLMVYDLPSLCVLRDSTGKQTLPIGWDTLSDDSHHRLGVLLFSAHDSRGQPTIPAEGWVELVVRNVANVPERVLRWTVPLFPGQ